jgi:hypothetical protein
LALGAGLAAGADLAGAGAGAFLLSACASMPVLNSAARINADELFFTVLRRMVVLIVSLSFVVFHDSA